MIQDFTKNYERWIDGLTKDQFDSFIKAFIKDYWGVDTVSITDGKGDGGVDVKIFEDKKNKKIPLQVTIDKNVYPKLEKDLVKIEKLIEEFNYSDNFYFFYSHGASEAKVIELSNAARMNHSITLQFFDNKLISTYIDKPEFYITRETLRNFLGDFVKEEESYFDENQKMYFDYLSYADESNELKERFITSFILNELFRVNEDKCDMDKLVLAVKNEFGSNITESYCTRLINTLLTNNKIQKNIGNNYSLVTNEKVKIKEIHENSKLLEREFSTKLQELISKFDSGLEIRIVIEKLNAIFLSQNQTDINEISNLSDDPDTTKEIRDFYNYIKNNFHEDDKYKIFIEEVFKLCIKNNFLAKISAGKLFKSLMDNPEFSAYTRRSNKEVFIDTPILIYLFLVFIEPESEYDNNRFKIAKELFDLIRSGDNSACFNTTQYYIKELADHFKTAIKLIPIHESGLFDSLGGSNNEIVNFYMSLKKEGIFDEKFKDFIESLGVQLSKIEGDENDEYLEQFLFMLFKTNSIQIDDVLPYNTIYNTKKDYRRVEKSMTEVYSRSGIERRPRSLKYDCLLLMHIYNIEEELIDATILTWDKSFGLFRQDFHSKNPNYRNWHLFKPGKFLDHMSLLKFKISGGAISKEILSMIEMEYEVVKQVRKVSDVLTTIIDLKSSSGIKLTQGLSEIRNTYIYQIHKDESDEIDSQEVQPVDKVISNLVDYYSYSKGNYSFNDFVNSLKQESVVKDLLQLLNDEVNYFIENRHFTDFYKSKFDTVIKNFISSNKDNEE